MSKFEIIDYKQKAVLCIRMAFCMSHYGDSNPGPTHYECVALPTEP